MELKVGKRIRGSCRNNPMYMHCETTDDGDILSRYLTIFLQSLERGPKGSEEAEEHCENKHGTGPHSGPVLVLSLMTYGF